jgi:saxitoxin biosynthesis operon SxtJ-like protein
LEAMTMTGFLAKFLARLAALPTHTKVLLCVATVVFLTELALRRWARGSAFYKKWSGVFLAIGHFWTAILLGVFYFVAVCPIALIMKALGQDPLDRKLLAESTAWRPHEANPLGLEAAARHQF